MNPFNKGETNGTIRAWPRYPESCMKILDRDISRINFEPQFRSRGHRKNETRKGWFPRPTSFWVLPESFFRFGSVKRSSVMVF